MKENLQLSDSSKGTYYNCSLQYNPKNSEVISEKPKGLELINDGESDVVIFVGGSDNRRVWKCSRDVVRLVGLHDHILYLEENSSSLEVEQILASGYRAFRRK